MPSDPDTQGIPVFSGDRLRATCAWPDRGRLVVRFDFWRADRSGFGIAPPGNSFGRSDCACLTIETAANDWFLNADLPALRRALGHFSARFDQATGFGFSMGGYGVLLLAPDLGLTQAILVSPQYSIRAEIAPFENRYPAEARLIDAHQDHLNLEYGRHLRGAVIHDPAIRADRLHKALICDAFPGLTPVPLSFGGHPALGAVHDAGRFHRILNEVLCEDVRPAAFLHSHRQARRVSRTYRAGLGRYLDRRRSRLVPAAE